MSKKFEVQTRFYRETWENCWHEDEKPQFFATEAEAKTAIEDFVESTEMECAEGNLETAMTHDDFRIMEVKL